MVTEKSTLKKRVRRASHWLRVLPVALYQGGGVAGLWRRAMRVYRASGWGGVKVAFDLLLRSGAALHALGYANWIQRYDTLDDDARLAIRRRISEMRNPPLISVVMPAYRPRSAWLREAIESVRSQIYPHWELCIADDASPTPETQAILKEFAERDHRIKVVLRPSNGHICAASNSALALAEGAWIALMDHDDLLAEHALFCIADEIVAHPDAQMIYSDEDKIDGNGKRSTPNFKPQWNVDLIRSMNYFSHLGAYRSELVRAVGGFRPGFEGSQDHDLVLRCFERVSPQQIRHIPRVLYHWRVHAESTADSGGAKPYAQRAGVRALEEHYLRIGVRARVEPTAFGYRTHYELPTPAPLVSLIIPTRNAAELVRQCIDSIQQKTTYPNYEIILVDNGSDDPAALAYFSGLAKQPNIRVMRDDREFNYSALNNAAVEMARGELIGLINNDIEILTPEWLDEMAGIVVQPGVGAVGASLWYPDKTLQHGGVVLGIGGVAGHAHKYLPRGGKGYYMRAVVAQSFSAVTAACLLVRKDVYEEVGGLDPVNLKIAFNDVDFCLRLREAGYRNVWTPYAQMFHYESATRGLDEAPEKKARFETELQYMRNRWLDVITDDPAYSLNLTLQSEDFSYAWPPRVPPFAAAGPSAPTRPS